MWFLCWTFSGAWAPGTPQLKWLRPVGLVLGGLVYLFFVASPWVWPLVWPLFKKEAGG